MLAHATSSALTNLLDSLHTHLQTQTQLLPSLHSQLGLPPSALEDDLQSLREELLKGVERQVETRRKQVEDWMSKCDAMEKECVRYSKALGGNVKSTGTSVGELRKEMTLPRRYELVAEHQEKLQQVYQSKLEQLTAITNRLQSLAQTLGSTFFSSDVLDPVVVKGEEFLGPDAHRDVSPERFLRLEKELVRGKNEVGKRLSQLAGIFVQIDWLYSELGISSPTVDDFGSSSTPGSCSSTTATPVLDPFLSTPTPSSRASSSMGNLFCHEPVQASENGYQRIFTQFVARIEEADDEVLTESQGIPYGLENVEPTPGLLSWAQNLQTSLEDLKRRREAHIQDMYDQLEGLWRRLGVDEAAMDAFVENNRGSTKETVREYEEELERMLELKRGQMGTFISSAREEIVKLWDDLMVSDDERADFAPFVDDENTEELLTIHEDEIRRLKEERRLKAPLLASIRRYFDICEEEKELALAAADQTRLLGRGPRDPGRLLREEKMRKRVSKEKPRLEQDLLASIPVWEQETGRLFLVHGESFLKQLMESVAAADQENKRKPTRAGSVPPRATTPVHSTNSYVPGTKAGVVTPAVRPNPAVSSHSLPNKRQKLNDSTAKGHGTTRAPLGNRRGNFMQARTVSPTKMSTRTPGSALRSTSLTIPASRRGTQHHFGYGKVGMRSVSAVVAGGQGSFQKLDKKSISGAGSSILKKASRAKRESFKPRPSTECTELGKSVAIGNTRWGGVSTSTVREEEGEGC